MSGWTHSAFKMVTKLNKIESKVYKHALFESDNLLVCAPSIAERINITVLTILELIGRHRNPCDGSVDENTFKVVHVTSKPFVNEVVRNLSRRLESYHVIVTELSEDQFQAQYEIEKSQIIVTTAEKWDIITRKFGGKTLTKLVKLFIIDEVYLLHDNSGPYLESIIARTHRQNETTKDSMRIVGLSSPFPNYKDVALFLHVDLNKGLFSFDASCRPGAFSQQYFRITTQDPLEAIHVMNNICYERVMAVVNPHQVIIYVNSSLETAETARAIKDAAIANGTVGRIRKEDSASCKSSTNSVVSNDLEELLSCGIAIHNELMDISDREMAIDYFLEGRVKVFVSTRTLDSGVNLPCHTVIIKGTKIYNPEKGADTELSPTDVMRMVGCAYNKGIIITGHDLDYYLSLVNGQLPIESQFASKLPDFLNAEIVRSTIQSAREANEWITYTFMYACMLNNPMYSLASDAHAEDLTLEKYAADLICTAAIILENNNLVTCDSMTKHFQFTNLGRICSYYGITHKTISLYGKDLKATMGDMDLCRLFSLSEEFRNLIVRLDEQAELARLLKIIQKHIPIMENLEMPSGKIIILLGAQILHLELEGLSVRLASDANFIKQSAESLLLALFEIALQYGWAQLAEKALNLCKTVNNKLHKFPNKVPKLVLEDVNVRPITKTSLEFDLAVIFDFEWDDEVHGCTEMFWVMLENDKLILHQQYFVLKKHYIGERHALNFKVSINGSLPPHYLIRVVSKRWPECQTLLTLPLGSLILPDEDYCLMEHTEVLGVPVTELQNSGYKKLYKDFKYFNRVQSQVFSALYNNCGNVLIAAPPGSGKTICAELAVLWNDKERPRKLMRVVYIAPIEALAEEMYHHWKDRFEGILDLKVVKLIGERITDKKLFQIGNIIISTPEKWDVLSRNTNPLLSEVSLFIVDDLHLIGGRGGHILEIILLRMVALSNYLASHTRIVALSTLVENVRDLRELIESRGPSCCTFDFPLCARPVPLDIQIQSFDIADFDTRMEVMVKTTFSAVAQNGEPTLVFVPTKEYAEQTVVDLLTYSHADRGGTPFFLRSTKKSQRTLLKSVNDKWLKKHLREGVGYLYEGMNRADYDVVVKLFKSGCLQVCVLSNYMCWEVQLSAYLVIVMGTQFCDGPIKSETDYPVSDVLQMTGHAGRALVDDFGKCLILCHSPYAQHYKKVLVERFPVESCLFDFSNIQDCLNCEIGNGSVESLEEVLNFLRMTFMYKWHTKNPNFYNVLHPTHVTECIQNLVFDALARLRDCAFIESEDDSFVELSPLMVGKIMSRCYVSCETIVMFLENLWPDTTMEGLLEVLCSTPSFNCLPTRYGKEEMVQNLIYQQRFPNTNPEVTYSQAKSYALLQAHLSRSFVDGYLKEEQREVVLIAHKLLSAMIYVTSALGMFRLTHLAIHVLQFVTQGMWENNLQLLQVPHFTEDLAEELLESEGIMTIYDLLEEKDHIHKIFKMSDTQLSDITQFLNGFPDINLSFEVIDHVSVGEDIMVQVTLEQNLKSTSKESNLDIDYVGFGHKSYKEISWWLFVVEKETDSLLRFQRVYLTEKIDLKLIFAAPDEVGRKCYTIYLMSDSYIGCDKEFDFTIDVV